MQKYCVVHGTISSIVEATDEEKAIIKFVQKKLTPYKSVVDKTHKGSWVGKVQVHELDDGTEYNLNAQLTVKIDEITTVVDP